MNGFLIPQHLLLQKFKTKNETHVPSVDLALQRAAKVGSTADLAQLISLGANINAQNKEGETALHLAIQAEKLENVEYLLTKFPKLHLVNQSGHTVITQASEAKNSKITKLFKDDAPWIFKSHDLLPLIFSFLPLEDLLNVKQVAYFWNESARLAVRNYLLSLKLNQNEMDIFYNTSSHLQELILKFIIEKKDVSSLKHLLHLLALSREDRIPLIFGKGEEPKFEYDKKNALLTDEGIVLSQLKILTEDEILSRGTVICNKYTILALVGNLLTVEDLKNTKLQSLLCANGIKALKLKLFTKEQATKIVIFDAVLSDNGIQALQEQLITPDQCITYSNSYNFRCLIQFGLNILKEKLLSVEQAYALSYHELDEIINNKSILDLKRENFISFEKYPGIRIQLASKLISRLSLLAKKEGKAALREGLLTVNQVTKINKINLSYLLSPNGLLALREKLFTVKEAETLNLMFLSQKEGLTLLREGLITPQQLANVKQLDALFSPNGMQLLREGWLTGQQVAEIKDLRCLLSDNGVTALKTNLITIEQAKNESSLAIFSYRLGLQALQENLITFQQLAKFKEYSASYSSASLSALLSESGLQALREKLITPEQATLFYHSGSCGGAQDNLAVLLNKTGLTALRKKLITPEEAANTCELEKMLNDNNPDILPALELQLISAKDFKYGGRLSFWGGGTYHNVTETIRDWVKNYQPPYTEKHQEAAIIIQNQWRMKLATQQFNLFKDLQKNMKAGNIRDIVTLSSIKNKIEHAQLASASNDLMKMKK